MVPCNTGYCFALLPQLIKALLMILLPPVSVFKTMKYILNVEDLNVETIVMDLSTFMPLKLFAILLTAFWTAIFVWVDQVSLGNKTWRNPFGKTARPKLLRRSTTLQKKAEEHREGMVEKVNLNL